VIDFDAAARDPNRPAHILAAFDSGDHLHPQDAGYKAMADLIDLKMLTASDDDPHKAQRTAGAGGRGSRPKDRQEGSFKYRRGSAPIRSRCGIACSRREPCTYLQLEQRARRHD